MEMVMATNYFAPSELLCKCGRASCDAPKVVTTDLLSKLNQLREKFGGPIIVNDALRCARHNAEVGGVNDSEHMTGQAADLRVDNSTDRLKLVKAAVEIFNRVGVGKTFLHVGVSPSLGQDVMWLY